MEMQNKNQVALRIEDNQDRTSRVKSPNSQTDQNTMMKTQYPFPGRACGCRTPEKRYRRMRAILLINKYIHN